MRKKLVVCCLTAFIVLASSLPALRAQSQQELADDLTALFRALRQAVVVNGASSQTPAAFFGDAANHDKFLVNAKTFYKIYAGKDFPENDGTPAGQLRSQLVEAAGNVMTSIGGGEVDFVWNGDNEYVSKWDGKMLPARFAAMLAAEFSSLTGGGATIKLTTSDKLLVNNLNAPDAWEAETIEAALLNTNKLSGEPQFSAVDGQFRYMLPEFYEVGCINCHGTADGQEGLSIHPSDLARSVGDFGGAISITLEN
jgi:hypothetical protein